jgi:hypothetical protein
MTLVPVLHQGSHILVSLNDYVATPAAIAAVRTAPRNKFLSPESGYTPAAITAFDFNFRLIYQILFPVVNYIKITKISISE